EVGKIISVLALFFLGTVLVAATYMIEVMAFFPLEEGIYLSDESVNIPQGDSNWGENVVQFLTVSEFNQLLSREHMLAFIIFSFLIGVAALRWGEVGNAFRLVLDSGNTGMKS